MAFAFHHQVEGYLDLAVLLFALIIMIWAFIHAALQRADAFTAVGSLRKNGWLGVLGGLFVAALLFNLVIQTLFSRMILYIGIGAAAYYLLDIRRGIKDVHEGPW